MKSIMQAAAFGIMAMLVLGAPNALAQSNHIDVCDLDECRAIERAYTYTIRYVRGVYWVSAHWHSLDHVIETWRGWKDNKNLAYDHASNRSADERLYGGHTRRIIKMMENTADTREARNRLADRLMRRVKHELSLLRRETDDILARKYCSSEHVPEYGGRNYYTFELSLPSGPCNITLETRTTVMHGNARRALSEAEFAVSEAEIKLEERKPPNNAPTNETKE